MTSVNNWSTSRARPESASAAPLPEDLQAKVRSELGGVYGPGLNLSFGQNQALIGGMRIKVGSDVYDGSVQARLTALQECFS